MEHRITISNTPIPPKEGRTGLLIHIEPPVPGLNPEAVTRYLTNRSLSPVAEEVEPGHRPDVCNVLMVASNSQETTIYADIKSEKEWQAPSITEDVVNNTIELLGFMGLQAAQVKQQSAEQTDVN